LYARRFGGGFPSARPISHYRIILFWVRCLVPRKSLVLTSRPLRMATPWSTSRHRILLDLLIRRRRELDLSQVELAKLLGKPQSYVSKFETGERRLDVFELIDICSALSCSMVGIVESLLSNEKKS